MNNLVNYFLESGICLAAFSLMYMLLLKKEKSFVFNRYYLLGSVVISMLIPFAHFKIGHVPEAFLVGTIYLDQVDLRGAEFSQSMPFANLLLYGYAIVVVILLARLTYQSFSLWLLGRRAEQHNGYKMIYLPGSTNAFTFLDTIYIGDQLTQGERDMILSHEYIHARERHSYDVIFMDITASIFWINPILLMIKKMVRLNHEYRADHCVLRHNNQADYVHTLASYTVARQGLRPAHQFFTPSIHQRIKMINKQNHRTMKIKQILPFVLALTLVVVFGCEDAAQQLSEQDDISAAKTISNYAMKDGAYDIVDVAPAPKEGMTEFYNWVAQTMSYPTKAKEEGVEGRVFVQFVLDENGKFQNVKAIKGIGAGCDKEAVDVIQQAKPWKPGLLDGKPVPVRMVLPISFKLRGA